MCLDVIVLFLYLPEKSQKDFTIFTERNKKYKMKFSRSETAHNAATVVQSHCFSVCFNKYVIGLDAILRNINALYLQNWLPHQNLRWKCMDMILWVVSLS